MTGSGGVGAARTRRAVLATGALGAALGVVGTACAGPGTQQAPQRDLAEMSGAIEFWHIWSAGNLSLEWLAKAKELFKQKAPRITVNDTFAAPLGEFRNKVTTASLAGNAPDVTYGDMYTTPLRGQSGENRALDALMTRDRINLADLVDYQAKRVLYEGKTYGLPFRPDTRILYANKQLMESSGLDPNRLPATWDEIWTAAERTTKISGTDIAQIGFYPAGPAGPLGNVWFWTFAWTNGAEFVDAKNVPTVNTRAHQETLEWFVRWAQRYNHANLVKWAADIDAGGSTPFLQAKQAFMVNTNGFRSRIERDAPSIGSGFGLIPSKTRKASWGAGFSLEMPAGGKNPDPAWEFVKFVDFDPEANRQAIQITSALVALKAVNASQEFTRDPFWKAVVDSLAVTHERPQVLEHMGFFGNVNTHVVAAVEGRESVKEALDTAQAEIMGEYEKNKKR